MKPYLEKYLPFLIFLAKFFSVYLVLSLLYQFFLSQYSSGSLQADGITQLVSRQVGALLRILGYSVQLHPCRNNAWVLVVADCRPIIRIIEGCNGVSIMILFAALVAGFNDGFFKTFIYIGAGFLVLHFLNVIRIALLVAGILHLPQYKGLLHGVIFPLVLYGFIFVMWMLWIHKIKDRVPGGR